jgi:hypothetical protein
MAFSVDSGIIFTFKKKYGMLKMNNSSIKSCFVLLSGGFHIASIVTGVIVKKLPTP